MGEHPFADRHDHGGPSKARGSSSAGGCQDRTVIIQLHRCPKCGSDRLWETLDGCVECLNCFPPQEWIKEQIRVKQLSKRGERDRAEVYGDLAEEADSDKRGKRLILI